MKLFLNHTLFLVLAFFCDGTFAQTAAEEEFSPYVFAHPYVRLPFKNKLYAKNWYGADVAYIQSPLLAPAKPSKPHIPQLLPLIPKMIVKWSDLSETHVNDENTWNFDKRIDSKALHKENLVGSWNVRICNRFYSKQTVGQELCAELSLNPLMQ